MLSEMEPAQFEEWFAYYRCRPWGDNWHAMSLQTARLQNTIREMAGDKFDQNDPAEDDGFVPKWYRPGESPKDLEKEAQLASVDFLDGFGV